MASSAVLEKARHREDADQRSSGNERSSCVEHCGMDGDWSSGYSVWSTTIVLLGVCMKI